jgi:hypothetical protein
METKTYTIEDPLRTTYGSAKTFFLHESLKKIQELTTDEKLFVYYMSMASISGYQLCTFQCCPHSEKLNEIMLTIAKLSDHPHYDELKNYWMFLYSSYGVHCQSESKSNKKTPKQLNLPNVTKELFESLGISFDEEEEKYFFDSEYKPTFTVLESIEESGGSFHGKNMTSELYDTMSQERKNMINAYHILIDGKVATKTYSLTGEHVEQMQGYVDKCIQWIYHAINVARRSEHFDEHTVKSLDLLLHFLTTGDENIFKEHCKEWLQIRNPHVDYCFGFIEYYDDPKSHVGTFQADVTIKSTDIGKLPSILPSIEERLPFPPEWKRKDMSSIPNASNVFKIMGTGGLGPSLSTIAYCLPNYDDIRSELGSKQIMYALPEPSSLDKYMKMYLSEKEIAYAKEVSPQLKLHDKVSQMTTILHETIGHASGSLVDELTNEIKLGRLGKWGNALEEMRAEIIALYVSITFYDELVATGILDDWPSKIPKEKMFELFIDDIAGAGWKRWRSVPKGTTEIIQAHAVADTAIMYYLIDYSAGNVTLNKESIIMEDKSVDVLRLLIKDPIALIPIIEKLLIQVQKMGSTAVFEEVDEFMKKYGESTRDPEYGFIVKGMREMIRNGVITSVQIFPTMTPIYTKPEHEGYATEVCDIEFSAPVDPYEACKKLWIASNDLIFR